MLVYHCTHVRCLRVRPGQVKLGGRRWTPKSRPFFSRNKLISDEVVFFSFVAGPVGTVKKPSVFCEALFKLRGESAFFADCHRSVSFHRPSVLSFVLLFSFFGPTHSFPQRNSAPGSPRNDDRQLARPAASSVLPLFKRMVPFQSTSPLAADNPDSDATVRSYKTESISRFPCVPPKRIGSPSDTPPHISGNATSVR